MVNTELVQIKAILDDALWFIDRPLPERVRLMRLNYSEQQAHIDDLQWEIRELREENARLSEYYCILQDSLRD